MDWIKKNTILTCEMSDSKKRAVCISPKQAFLTEHIIKEYNLLNDGEDLCVSISLLGEFVGGAMDGNIHYLDMLFSRDKKVLHHDEYGAELLETRVALLSKKMVRQMLKDSKGTLEVLKSEKYLPSRAVFLMKILKASLEIASTYNYTAFESSMLLIVREELISQKQVFDMAEDYIKKIEKVLLTTALPEEPNILAISEWVESVKKRYVVN